MVRKFTTAVELPGDPSSGLQATTKDYVDTALLPKVPTSRSVLAGTGLTGGGTLAADRTLVVDFGTGSGKVVQGDDSRLSDSRAPTGTAGGALSGTYPNPSLDTVPWGPVVLTDGVTINTDASLGNHFRVTLGGNRTLANPTGLIDGQRLTWEITQDAVGGRTLSLGSFFAFGSDITGVVLSTTPSKTDFIGGIYNSSASKIFIVSVIRGF